MRIVRVDDSGRVRVGLVDDGVEIALLDESDPVAVLRAADLPARRDAAPDRVTAFDGATLALPDPYRLLAPIDAPEVWAAGVTYERSRDARVAESEAAKDVYAHVYDADRPEIFLKDAAGRRTVGPGGDAGLRPESTWTVPEPELALVLAADGSVLALTIADDVTARDVEAQNPLYLPQAKLFGGGLVLGPCLVAAAPDAPRAIDVTIDAADGSRVWEASTSTARMKRTCAELIDWLRRSNPLPDGCVLCTGTGVVPPDDVALAPGMRVAITIEGIGRLEHGVVTV